MAADLSGIAYFAPILAFLIVFIIVFAMLQKTKLFGDKFPILLNLFIGFVVATLFVSAAGVTRYVTTIVPWIAVLVISLFFIVLLLAFVGKETEFMHKGIGVGVVVVGVLIFLVSGVVVFSDIFTPYLPFSSSYTGNEVSDWLYSPPVVGAILLIVIAGIASWVLVKAK